MTKGPTYEVIKSSNNTRVYWLTKMKVVMKVVAVTVVQTTAIASFVSIIEIKVVGFSIILASMQSMPDISNTQF